MRTDRIWKAGDVVACSQPLIAFVRGVKENGKKDIVFANNSKLDFYRDRDGRIYTEKLEIPCGQCMSCRLQYSRQWADRCLMELKYHDSAYFVTLTYSDEWLNRDDQIGKTRRFYASDENGSASVSLSLYKKDLQDFFKRLRYEFPDDKIRYFACGEYGDKSKRPHYHAIIYGLHLNDLKYYKLSNLNEIYYNSEKLNSIWKRGYVVVGSVSWQSCAYVARYVTKKAKGVTADSYATFNMDPEFVVMSRRPGIGYGYLEEHKEDFLRFGETFLSDVDRSIRCMTPRYFKQKLDLTDADRMEIIRNRQIKKAKDCVDAKLELCDYDIQELRKIEEDNLIERSKALKREL